jgi:hypothetical protein
VSSERITGEIKTIRRKLNHRPEGIMPPVHPPLPGTIRFVDVQVYDVPAVDLPADLFSVESTLEPEEGGTQETPMQDEDREEPPQEPVEPTEHVTPTRARLHPFPFVLGMLCVVFAGAVSVVYALPLLAPSATVTIIPDSRQITTHTTVRVVTGVANSGQQQLQGRMLSSLTMSQAQTVPTRGMGHQDAQAAHGRITFYNAAPYGQTVPAGTLLTGTDRVQVVTDQDAVIPAVTYPTLGQATVPAHAVTTGPGGNIRAGDIYGPCCRLDLSAVNAAFSGGQDARSYRMVTAQDIIGVATRLATSLGQSAQAALQTQVQSDETLITPVPCKQTVTPDHAAGDDAAQVQITVDETCTGEAYHTQAYHDLIRQIVSQQAMKQLGEGYTLAGDIQATITSLTMKDHGVVDLEVTGAGIWAYQFSQAQLQHLKRMIAGESEKEAKAIVLHIPGVQTVSLSIRNGTTIPTDVQQIHLVFVEIM